MKKTKVGVVGCGMISDFYLSAAKRFRNLDIVACADIIHSRAEAKEAEFGCKALSCTDIMKDPEIEMILNLTPPQEHTKVAMAALNAGKHTYSEKPFGVDIEDAKQVLKLAKEKNLRVGCAPDTFLGGGLQTARKLVDDNWIGKVKAGTAVVASRGPEKWGHAPFFYDKGAGPFLDMGPYYVTALVNLLGPAKSVSAVTFRGSEYRTLGEKVAEQYQDKYEPYGKYPVNVNTHYTGVIEFHSGAVITLLSSFEVYRHGHNPIELYGEQGSLLVPDPNQFTGPVKLFRREWPYADGFKEVPLVYGHATPSRSIGAADMAMAIKTGRPHRASSELAFHVLDVILSFEKSSQLGAKVEITSTCERPAPLPLGLEDGMIDE